MIQTWPDLKAFALGLSVATRGMDHLRNRVTLEINARINDDAPFKTQLYGGSVAAAPVATTPGQPNHRTAAPSAATCSTRSTMVRARTASRAATATTS